MTGDQRQALIEKSLADLLRRGKGYVVFEDAVHGDNYAEVTSELRVEVSHRRWPACQLPPLSADALRRLDRLGFRESERNLTRTFEGWSFARIARHLESVFVEVYGCPAAFDLRATAGE